MIDVHAWLIFVSLWNKQLKPRAQTVTCTMVRQEQQGMCNIIKLAKGRRCMSGGILWLGG
jgi:hypothetical protein